MVSIPCNQGYIDQTRRRLETNEDKYRLKVNIEEIYSSFIVLHCSPCNQHFASTKAGIEFTPTSSFHLNFPDFDIVKYFHNLVSKFSSATSISDFL